ncbi:MAG: FAD-binding protein, partial [Oscillospiraceae bacterium]|nr:FAD-binding protein [Oscillospiraceae bacterium]
HYFMGGIDTDEQHRTNLRNLYAAGECTCQYHGANRLGGNSMLGALYGGRKSAETIIETAEFLMEENQEVSVSVPEKASPVLIQEISQILLSGLGIVRSQETLQNQLNALEVLANQREYSFYEQNRLLLAEAMLRSALERRESRGAHYREDYPDKDETFRKTTVAECDDNNQVRISFRPIPEKRADT